MTKRWYLEDAKKTACDAVVLSCEAADGHWHVTLSESVFFPNKGGQPCDTGTLGTVNVLSCDESGEMLVHTVDAPLAVGSTVRAQIDWERRFDIMQQHTGEHLLSYCAWKLFDAVNVGFHCALEYATLDLDRPVDAEGIRAMERMANRIAAENRTVTATIYATEDEGKALPLRKHSEGLTAPIRIVTIDGADACTCCAPHVERTGEIGLMKITEAVAYKGGMRLTFLCGMRALGFVQEVQTALDTIARGFSTGRDRAVSAVEKMKEELSDSKRELKQASARLEGYLAKELQAKAEVCRGISVLVERVEQVEAKRLRPLALGTLTDRSFTALFSVNGEQVSYILASKGLKKDMGELILSVNLALNGKGGGRGELAQGSAALRPDLNETLEQLRNYFKKAL